MGFTFVQPGTVKIDIGDGDWIEVKRELSAGELKAMRTASFTYMQGKPDGETDKARADGGDEEVKLGVDWRKLGVARIMAYVLDWNAKDAQGRPVAFSRDAIEQLSIGDFERIEKAINAHAKQIEAEKNAKAGEKT